VQAPAYFSVEDLPACYDGDGRRVAVGWLLARLGARSAQNKDRDDEGPMRQPKTAHDFTPLVTLSADVIRVGRSPFSKCGASRKIRRSCFALALSVSQYRLAWKPLFSPRAPRDGSQAEDRDDVGRPPPGAKAKLLAPSSLDSDLSIVMYPLVKVALLLSSACDNDHRVTN
jgi:hypothetical protein